MRTPKMGRTPKQILGQTNDLAREFYRIMGYVVPFGYDFSAATHPQERQCWEMAKAAQLELTDTDLDDVLDDDD